MLLLARVKYRLALLLVLGACDDPAAEAPSETRIVQVASFPAERIDELDLLFMIDDSTGADYENVLARNIGVLFDALAAPALPDLHVGVGTSDLGSTGSLDPAAPAPTLGTVGVGGCGGLGDDGRLQISAAPIDGTFLVDVDDGSGGRARNYTGTLGEAVAPMLRVGSNGCGFEQPLRAIRRTLEANPAFRRAGASLAVIVFADEDDCSIRDAGLFTTETSVLGPVSSFRCTAHGIVCDEPLDAPGDKHGCRPRVDSQYVEDPAVTASFLATQATPEQLTFSAIVGDPTPFALETRTINAMDQLALAHSCITQTETGPQVGDPGLRTVAVAESFASRGAWSSICQRDYSAALRTIALPIKRSLGIACIDTAPLADTLAADGIQPACEARDVLADGTQRALPRCPADGDCFDLVADAEACAESADHARVVVTRAQPAPAGTRTEVYCEAPAP